MATDSDLIALEKKLIEKQEKIDQEKEDLDQEKEKIKKIQADYQAKLEKSSSLTREEAKAELLAEVEKSETEILAKIIKEREEEAKRSSDKKSQEILIEAMRHGALNRIAEYTVSVVKVTDEDIKGRIIGKEGRNIRAFEQATGVDVDLDEEGVIRLSSFDQVRREVARRAIEKLVKDTRIQPFRIEEIVKETQTEVEKIMLEEGQKLAHELGVFNLPSEITSVLGRTKFRTSYGQNLLMHLRETTTIGLHLAEETGVDVSIVRIGALLHDIGKVLPGEGSHVTLGVEFLKKHNIPDAIIACVAEHHEDKPFSSLESVLVHIADSISGARPGARYEDVEEYGKRLTEMEDIAKKYEGVEDAFAFEAGRELRVIIDPGKLDDSETVLIADKIRQEVSSKLAIPGEVKVTAIREFRAVSPNSAN